MIALFRCFLSDHAPTIRERDDQGKYWLVCPRCGHKSPVEQLRVLTFRKAGK